MATARECLVDASILSGQQGFFCRNYVLGQYLNSFFLSQFLDQAKWGNVSVGYKLVAEGLNLTQRFFWCFNNRVNDYMKKHGSAAQFLTVRERPTISTIVPPTSDPARQAKKRKLTEKIQPSSNLTMSMIAKQPLGISGNANNMSTPLTHNMLKNKSSETHPRRAKENLVNGSKKSSISNLCFERKQSVRIDAEPHCKTLRSTKVPVSKQIQNRGYASSRIVNQSMSSLERYSELHSRQLHTIMETNRPDYPAYSQTVRYSCLEVPEATEDKEEVVRDIVLEMVDSMFHSHQFKFSQLAKENHQLKQELLKIKQCYELLEKQRHEGMTFVQSRLILKEGELSGLQQATQGKECLIAELEYKLAEAQQQLQSYSSPELERLQSLVHSLQSQLSEQRSKFQTCERQSETFRRQLAATKKENAVIRRENNHYRSILTENESRLNEYCTTIAELQANADHSEKMVMSLQTQLFETQSQLRATPSQLVNNLRDLVAQSSSEIFRLNREISSLEIKLAIIERRHMEEIDRMKGVHHKQLKTWRQRNKKLLKCNASLKRLVDEQRQDMSIDFSLNDQREIPI